MIDPAPEHGRAHAQVPERPVMTFAKKRQDRADEYRDLAVTASRLAAASGLVQVRAMHLRAGAAWTQMADLHDRLALDADLRLAALNALPTKAPKKPKADHPMCGFDVPAPDAACGLKARPGRQSASEWTDDVGFVETLEPGQLRAVFSDPPPAAAPEDDVLSSFAFGPDGRR